MIINKGKGLEQKKFWLIYGTGMALKEKVKKFEAFCDNNFKLKGSRWVKLIFSHSLPTADFM
jgi:hypothetical protein